VQPFKLTEEDREPGCREIHIEGELDLSVADRLKEALESAAPEYAQILIDLERCEFIDSTGIAVIVRARNLMVEQGGRLAVYGPSKQVLRIFTITGLTGNGFKGDDFVFENAEDALAAGVG
jgi:anti-sigma B factor antagonist